MTYEFDDTEASFINSLGNTALASGAFLAISGIILIIDALTEDDGVASAIMSATISSFEILIAIMFILPALALRRIYTTEGNDVGELLDGMRRFSTAFYTTITLLVVAVFLELGLLLI